MEHIHSHNYFKRYDSIGKLNEFYFDIDRTFLSCSTTTPLRSPSSRFSDLAISDTLQHVFLSFFHVTPCLHVKSIQKG